MKMIHQENLALTVNEANLQSFFFPFVENISHAALENVIILLNDSYKKELNTQ